MTAKKLTAEELAVKMEMGNHDWADDAAEMLRQQQSEIEALKAKMSLSSYDDAQNVAYQLLNEKISLWDYFAANALQGLISGCYSGNNVGFTVEGNVFAACEYADAMMKAREK